MLDLRHQAAIGAYSRHLVTVDRIAGCARREASDSGDCVGMASRFDSHGRADLSDHRRLSALGQGSRTQGSAGPMLLATPLVIQKRTAKSRKSC